MCLATGENVIVAVKQVLTAAHHIFSNNNKLEYIFLIMAFCDGTEGEFFVFHRMFGNEVGGIYYKIIDDPSSRESSCRVILRFVNNKYMYITISLYRNSELIFQKFVVHSSATL